MRSQPNKVESKKNLAQIKSLEARIEALEFIVLGVLRASKDNPICKRSVIDTFELLDKVLETPEMKQSEEYCKACRMAYADAIMLAWGDVESEFESGRSMH